MEALEIKQNDEALCVHYQRTIEIKIIGEFFRRYHKVVLLWYVKWNYKNCGGRLAIATLEDLTADIFAVHLEKSLQRAGTIQNFQAWLRKLAYNRLIDYLRKQKITFEANPDNFFEKNMELPTFQRLFSCQDIDFDSPEGLSWQEVDELLRQWNMNINDFIEYQITTLKKPLQSQCLLLFFLQKKTYQEITEATQFSLKEVKSYLQNGRRNLQKRIASELKRICYERT